MCTTGADAQYQWSCSALDAVNDQYTLPDFGDLLLDDDRSIPQRRRRSQSTSFPSSSPNLYIYELPSMLNCSGTVSAVRYCFRESSNTEIFSLLILEVTEVGYSISNTINVSSTVCTRARINFRCCDILMLTPLDQFHISAHFAFGVVRGSQLLGFSNNTYLVEQYSQIEIESVEVGTVIRVGNVPRSTNETLRMLQFIISELLSIQGCGLLERHITGGVELTELWVVPS